MQRSSVASGNTAVNLPALVARRVLRQTPSALNVNFTRSLAWKPTPDTRTGAPSRTRSFGFGAGVWLEAVAPAAGAAIASTARRAYRLFTRHRMPGPGPVRGFSGGTRVTYFLRAITVTFACALLVSACSSESNGSKISAGQLESLVLAGSDLPAPFRAFAEGPTATLDTRGTPRADPQRFGRKGGWVARFNRPGTASTEGPLVVASTVDVFGDTGGAKDDLAAYRAQFSGQVRSQGGTTRLIEVRRLGDQAVGVTSVQPGGTPVRFFTIAWREGNATASVTANGFGGRIQLADVLALARLQERKLARA